MREICAVVVWWRTLLVLIFSVAFVGYAAYWCYWWFIRKSASMEVTSQPREPMFECSKHGVMREKHLIRHLDQKVCPYCLSERVATKLDSTVN